MFARLINTIVSHPDLVLDHVDNYVDLLRTDTQSFKQALTKRLLSIVVFAVALLLSIMFGGVVIMLWAVGQGHLWILPALPIALAALALAAYMFGDSKRVGNMFASTREQAREDAQMLKQAMHTP